MLLVVLVLLLFFVVVLVVALVVVVGVSFTRTEAAHGLVWHSKGGRGGGVDRVSMLEARGDSKYGDLALAGGLV